MSLEGLIAIPAQICTHWSGATARRLTHRKEMVNGQ